MARLHALLSAVALFTYQAAAYRDHDKSVLESVDWLHTDLNLSTVLSAELTSTLESLSDLLLEPELSEKTNIADALNAASHHMDMASAVKVVEMKHFIHKPDVTKLIQRLNGNPFEDFDEGSLGKARRALNELAEDDWSELDNHLFKCKAFQDMNRQNFAQVTRDIMRLIESINDLGRIESEAIEGMSSKDQEIVDQEAMLAKETKLYNIEFAENKRELTVRQNDLDVFQFVLVFTKCPDATSLTQAHMRVCETRSGRKTIFFTDKEAAGRYRQVLTPFASNSIDKTLRALSNSQLYPTLSNSQLDPSESGTSASFIQQPANQSTTPQPRPAIPVKGQEGKDCGGLDPCVSCGPDPPDCAILHDKLSLLWGESKDKVDELTMEMMKNQIEYEEIKANLNANIRLLVAAKARFQQLLAEARSNLAADRTELKEKYKQKAKLNKQYYAYTMLCKKRTSCKLCEMMAVKTVRNAIMENSTECPSATITDCNMDTWVPEQCSVSCDNSCDPSQPYKCGGWQKMTRKPVVQNNNCGIRCPVMVKYMRCGQFPCPVNCRMSTWSGWSKCTAECEGGVQMHTRSIRVKPQNGGEQCNTLEENRPCNTMSCDRDCRLQRWTKWSPCSVACGGGFQERFRHVLIPTRGEGKCPKEMSRFRYRKQQCNTQQCNGDEICIAVQDLVIAIDGSGSLRESGFKVLKDYVVKMLTRYETAYFGKPAVKVGIVLFGNGVIMPDGKTISPAISAQRLTSNMIDAKSVVEGLPFKKGFTNMAQAFAMADDMFTKGSRKEAQHSVMVVTDGKPSLSFATNEMVEQLEDKGISRYFVVVSETLLTDSSMKNMKTWASRPWETNLIRVTGLLMLEADMDLWVEKALTKFCPSAYSPSAADYRIKTYGFQHIRDAGWCGEKLEENILSKSASAEECAVQAVAAGKQSFMLGTNFRRGWCIGGTMSVSANQYEEWMTSEGKANPRCPAEGGWKAGALFKFYAIEPVAM